MSSTPSRLLLMALAAGVAVAGWVGWNPFRRSSPIAGIRNIVIVSIDTCRADRLSCYGFKRPTTPHIDAVAREGVLFQAALTPVPLTTPAHSSMLTGTYPPTHGVRLNNGEALAGFNVTLAETLRDAGFRTAAFVGGLPLDPQFGLDQGFQTYDGRFTAKSETPGARVRRLAEEVSRPALAWLDGHTDKPFFLFLHYYDAHLPYEPQPPFASAYADDPYAGEIAYVDSWIGRILDRLRALGAYDTTLLIITGDHGEGLGEHGEKAHGLFIYQSSLHVPLIIRAPHGRKGARVEGRVSLVDLVPTVLDLAGLKTPARMDGTSLRGALEGRPASGAPRQLYCESLQATQFDCSSLDGVVEGTWKYIRAPREELYDLKDDAGETSNVVGTQPEVAQRLRESLQALVTGMHASSPDGAAPIPDPDTVKRLQSLGYVGGGATPDTSAFDPAREDPKDFRPTFERLNDANTLIELHRTEDAKAVLLSVVASRPGLVAAHSQLADIARSEHRPAEAVEHYSKIVAVLSQAKASASRASDRSNLATAHFDLAYALRELGNDQEAIAHYQQALSIKPDYVDARNSLGLVLAHAGRFKEAIAQYELALKTEPGSARVHNNLGNALQQTGMLAEAIGHYEQALRINPDMPSALTNMALIRASALDSNVRNGAEAVRLAERACGICGRGSVSCLDVLGIAYAEAQRFDEAIKAGEAALALARAAKQTAVADEIQTRLALYREHRPYRALSAPRR